MLVKLTTSVNFINVICAAFMPADPKSVKRYWLLNWIFTLLGSEGVKAAHRTLAKLTTVGLILPTFNEELSRPYSFNKNIT